MDTRLTRPAPPDIGATGVGHAHAKAILLGEHAVLYGAAAIAVPLPRLTATALATRTVGAHGITFSGVASEADGGLRRMAAAFAERTRWTADGVDVRVDCAIPSRRGLGSSAACARAAVLALAGLSRHHLDDRAVFDLVQESENVAHGRASGVDALATGSPAPILFRGGTATRARIGFDAVVVVADSGAAGRTREAVDLVRRGFDRVPGARERFVGDVVALTDAAVDDLARGDAVAFGERLTACHSLLKGLGLSTDLMDALVDAAITAGAAGGKLSGGGLGGCVVALAHPGTAGAVARAMTAAGAARTWAVPLGRSTDER
ncbi:mevalonate kinase [Actinokineospora soli]|uniref:Mevalonate kinase n=1 Tax=Actinokineospora soli TaxID=1048753 RepID=A0ABW2TP71_9PSEU